MLLILAIAALINLVFLAIACSLLYFLVKRRRQLQTARKSSNDTEMSPASAVVVPSTPPQVPVMSVSHSTQSLNSIDQHCLPPNLCPTPSRTPFGGVKKSAAALNETFASSISSLGYSIGQDGLACLNTKLEALRSQRNQISLNQTYSSSVSSLGLNSEDIANLNAQLESMRNQSYTNERDDDSGYGSGVSSDALGKALDEVLAMHNRMEHLKAEQKSRRNRTVSFSLPQENHASIIYASSTRLVLNPASLNMEF